MKQRVTSGVVIFLITVASVLGPNSVLKVVLGAILAYGCFEIVNIQNKEFNPILYGIMLISSAFIYLLNQYVIEIILFEFILLITVAIFDEKENITDISITYMFSIVIGFACYYMDKVQAYNKFMLGYIIAITYLTDVFAYFVGRKFGKHKLNERVSPKKTIEGSLGGWLIGAVFSFVWAAIFGFFSIEPYIIAIASLILPIISEIGDLAFSLIKRHYNVKDYSNLIPGHGGLLDRLDSTIFCILFFGAFINFFI